ncbi:MAG TPA: DMT family transporter [Chitinophagaceae bacterium]|nr:DMT family transporter [Chitinophagaceae bacterium]
MWFKRQTINEYSKQTNNKNSISLTGFIIAILGAIMFSTKAIIVKRAFADIHVAALTLLALRMLFSLPFYVAAAFINSGKKENIKFTAKQWFIVFVLGMLGYYTSSLLDFIGLQYVSAGMERLILFLYPTFAVLINAYWFKQKISAVQKWALAITYSGIALAYFGEINVYATDKDFIWGSFLIFICAITFSLYIVGSGRMIPVIGASKFTAYAMLAATFGVLLHFVIAKKLGVQEVNSPLEGS